jgi:hypothetical protein
MRHESVSTPTLSFSRVLVLLAASMILTRPRSPRQMPDNSSLSSFELPSLSSRAYPIYSPALCVKAGFSDKSSLVIFECLDFLKTSEIAKTAKSVRLLPSSSRGPENLSFNINAWDKVPIYASVRQFSFLPLYLSLSTSSPPCSIGKAFCCKYSTSLSKRSEDIFYLNLIN